MSNSEVIYGISRPVLGGGRNNHHPISQDKYETIKKSIFTIRAVGSIEILFAVVNQSFFDLERGLLSASLENLIFNPTTDAADWTEHRVQRIKLSNSVLSACRAYFDQTDRLLKKNRMNSEIKTFNEKRSKCYDGSYKYRIAEEFRNYAQHVSIPFHQIGYSIDRDEREGEKDGLSYSSSFHLDPKLLLEDKRFLKIKKDLENLTHMIDITEILRFYVSDIHRIHSDLCDALGSRLKRAIACQQSALDEYWKHRDPTGLPFNYIAAVKGPRPEISDEIIIFNKEHFKDIERMRKKYLRRHGYEISYVSSRLANSKKLPDPRFL